MKAKDFKTQVIFTEGTIQPASGGPANIGQATWVIRGREKDLLKALQQAEREKGGLTEHKDGRAAWVGGYLTPGVRPQQPKRDLVDTKNVLVFDLDGAKSEESSEPRLTDADVEDLLYALPYPAVVNDSPSSRPDWRRIHVFVPLASHVYPEDVKPLSRALFAEWKANAPESLGRFFASVSDTGGSLFDTSAWVPTQITFLSGCQGKPSGLHWVNCDRDVLEPLGMDLTPYQEEDRGTSVQPGIDRDDHFGFLTRACGGTLAGAVQLAHEIDSPYKDCLLPTSGDPSCPTWYWYESMRGAGFADAGDGNVWIRYASNRFTQDSGGHPCKSVGHLFFDIFLYGYGRGKSYHTSTDSEKWFTWSRKSVRTCLEKLSSPKAVELLQEYEDFCSQADKRRSQERAEALFSKVKAAEEKISAAKAPSSDLAVSEGEGWYDLIAEKAYVPADLSADELVDMLNTFEAAVQGCDIKEVEKSPVLREGQLSTLVRFSPALNRIGRDVRTQRLVYLDSRVDDEVNIYAQTERAMREELARKGGYSSYGANLLDKAISEAADEKQVNPLISSLLSYAREAQESQDRLLGTVCPWLEDPTPYQKQVFKSIILGMVSRTLLPGIKLDLMPIVQGGQGTGKTSLLHALGLAGLVEGVAEGEFPSRLLQADDDKEVGSALMSASASLLALYDEWDSRYAGRRKVSDSAIKAFLSKSEWTFVPKYKSQPVNYKISFMPVATSNSPSSIPCDDGWRRYPIIEIEGFSDDVLARTSEWYHGERQPIKRVVGEAVLEVLEEAYQIGGRKLVAAIVRPATPHPPLSNALLEIKGALATLNQRLAAIITDPYRRGGSHYEAHREAVIRHMEHSDVGRAMRYLAHETPANVDGNVTFSYAQVDARFKQVAGQSREVFRQWIAGWATVLGGAIDETRGLVRLPKSCGQVDPSATADGSSV